MARNLDSIKLGSKSISKYKDDLKSFQILLLSTLSYSPDRTDRQIYENHLNELRKVFGQTAELEAGLERDFFDVLYVDRDEQFELKQMIPFNRLILIAGLAGCGKTAMLRKIKKDFDELHSFNFDYFDLKAAENFLTDHNSITFTEFRAYVYNYLINKYVNNANRTTEWNLYLIQSDPKYAAVRQKLLYYAQIEPSEKINWDNLLSHEHLRNFLFDEGQFEPSLDTLIKFLQTYEPLALCFDNVDRYPLVMQAEIFSHCIDISNVSQIPILLAIRHENLQRIVKEGEQGDITYSIPLEQLKLSYSAAISVDELPIFSAKDLIARRIDYLRNFDVSSSLNNFVDNFSINTGTERITIHAKLWQFLESISETFFENAIIRLCNNNIRLLLFNYTQFFYYLLRKSEQPYSFEKLILSESKANITLLRTSFYKWLICRGDDLPSQESGLLNIFEIFDSGSLLSMFDLNILEYLYNLRVNNKKQSIKFNDLIEVIQCYGKNRDHLLARLDYLSSPHRMAESAFVYCDRNIRYEITEESNISLTPAGIYFLEVLSISREYAFWTALNVDIEVELIQGTIPYDKTYEDDFKLSIVFRFIKWHLLPLLAKGIESVRDKRNAGNLNINDIYAEYKYKFWIWGKPYAIRLLESVLSTIPFAKITTESKESWRKEYIVLMKHTYDLLEACMKT